MQWLKQLTAKLEFGSDCSAFATHAQFSLYSAHLPLSTCRAESSLKRHYLVPWGACKGLERVPWAFKLLFWILRPGLNPDFLYSLFTPHSSALLGDGILHLTHGEPKLQ